MLTTFIKLKCSWRRVAQLLLDEWFIVRRLGDNTLRVEKRIFELISVADQLLLSLLWKQRCDEVPLYSPLIRLFQQCSAENVYLWWCPVVVGASFFLERHSILYLKRIIIFSIYILLYKLFHWDASVIKCLSIFTSVLVTLQYSKWNSKIPSDSNTVNFKKVVKSISSILRESRNLWIIHKVCDFCSMIRILVQKFKIHKYNFTINFYSWIILYNITPVHIKLFWF